MESPKSFDYIFAGNDYSLLENIQINFEKRGIYPAFRKIDNISEIKKALEGQAWDLLLIEDIYSEVEIENIVKTARDIQRFIPVVLLYESFDPIKMVSLVKKGLSNISKKDDLETLYNVVIKEINEEREKKKKQKYENLKDIASQYEVVKRFAGNLSHSISNVLMVILNTAEFLIEDVKQLPHIKDDVEQIIRMGKKGQEISKNLLKVSGGLYLNTQVIPLDSILNSLMQKIRGIRGSGVDIEFKPPAISCEVKVDQVVLMEALGYIVNYVNRIISNNSNIRLEVECLSFDRDDPLVVDGILKAADYAKIAISIDREIPEEVRLHLFEPYYPDSGGPDRASMDLSMSYGIIWEHNGVVSVEGERNKTTFLIYLPIYRVDSKEVLVPRRAIYAPSTKGSVLIVEDDEEVKNVLMRIFSQEGYSVFDAVDGLGALVMIQRVKPDNLVALVTDVVMPKMGGLELAREVKKAFPNLKVIFISGYPDNEREVLRFENSIFLQKPISREELVKRVRQFLRGEE